MSRIRLGKRERAARKSPRKFRGRISFIPKGQSEYVTLKLGHRKWMKLNTSGRKAESPK
jgi:hypothetical protein